MSLINLFFRQEVTIKPFIRQGSGEPIYGKPEVRKCRFERGLKNKNVKLNPDGVINSYPAGSRLYCTGPAIPIQSIVLYENHEYIVVDCRVLNGFTDDHLEVTLE